MRGYRFKSGHSDKITYIKDTMSTNKQEYDREYHANRSPEAKARKQRLQVERLQRMRTRLDEYKATLRCDCGENHIACLDFHHVTGDKEFNISDGTRNGYAYDKILKEIEKCIVICANCHRKLHHEERLKKFTSLA